MKRLAFFALLIGGGAAVAADDSLGWKAGTPAKNAGRVLSPMPEEIQVDLPAVLREQIDGPTLLVYFSPGCPHCTAAAPEIGELARRQKGRVDVIGVATGRSRPDDIAAFKVAYGWDFPVLLDESGRIGDAMRVNSTPSALLVRPERKKLVVVDFWYPYLRGFDVLIAMRTAEDPWSAWERGRYVGNAACGACHVDETDAWSLSLHAVAYRRLVERKEATQAGCIDCHVTGWGEPGGFSFDDDARLGDVGCEACHGPGGPHDGERVDAGSRCASCHDDKHAIGFQLSRALPLIDHYQTLGWTDVQWREQREKLVSGETAQRNVGFAEGSTLGAAACTACHAPQTTQWAAGPHAKAMQVLPEDKRADPACVRCHATARKAGPAVASVDGYRVDEGVGCEACHGPGEAHAASQRPEDTEGLGDDCPVCVVEALCTACHTPEHDPDWSLTRDLPLAGHQAP